MAERFSEFNATKAGEALHSQPLETRDVEYGTGQIMSIGDTTLEVYQDAGVARVTTTDAQIKLVRVPTYQVSPERLVFEQGEEVVRARLLVRSNGRVSFYPVSGAAESSATQEPAPSNQRVSPSPLDASRPATARPDDAPAADPEHQEPVQLQLTGRLGSDPWFNDQGDQPTAGFPLAVNGEAGKTTWHRVVVSGDLAQQVRTSLQAGQIRKGRLVQVSGTEVVQSEKTAKGGTRTTTQFHATSVIRITGRPAK